MNKLSKMKIKNSSHEKFCFFIMCLGNMGASAKLSIQSMLLLAISQNFKIYILADYSGKAWIIENFGNSVYFEFIIITQTRIPKDLRYRFKEETITNYSQFGSDSMKLLTPLKWIGLMHLFNRNENFKIIIYSDIDVIWTDFPSSEVEFLMQSEHLALIQDDSSIPSKKYYCTGIQIWKASKQTVKFLNLLYNFHISSHNSNFRYRNMLLGDEKAFNLWIAKKNSKHLFHPLERKNFIIGHEIKSAILRLLIGKIPIAVHANYRYLESQKFHALNAFTKSFSGWTSRFITILSK